MGNKGVYRNKRERYKYTRYGRSTTSGGRSSIGSMLSDKNLPKRNIQVGPQHSPANRVLEKVSINLEDWRKLYEVALNFRNLHPWTHMSDDIRFGIQNPVDGMVGYCSIMGALGTHYALGVYRGSGALAKFLDISAAHEFDPPSAGEFIYSQDCIMLSFEDRKHLAPEDLAIIAGLGLSFRGSSKWPLFRSYVPGYMPAPLTLAEIRFLTIAIDQTNNIVTRYHKNPGLLDPPEENEPDEILETDETLYFIRVFDMEGNGKNTWRDEWRPPEQQPTTKPTLVDLDPRLLTQVQRGFLRRGGAWEMGLSLDNDLVQDKEGARGYFPQKFIWVDHRTNLILNFAMEHPDNYERNVLHKLLQTIVAHNTIPSEIWVQDTVVHNLLGSLPPELKINVKKVRKLPAFEEVNRFMSQTGFM